jgi:hypothetical protein
VTRKKIETKQLDTQTEIDKTIVYSVLEFARALAGSLYPSILTPDLINSRLKEISYNPLAATEDSLNKALSDPKQSEDQLRSFVEYYEAISAPIRRIISYMASQLSLDLLYTVTNAELEDYKSVKFKKDQKIVYDWLDRFDYQTHFRNVIKQVLRNEIFACCVREEGQKIVIQELPIQYCKITSKWDFGYLIDFNFYYFLLPGVSLDGFPDFFKKKFAELFGGESGYKTYNPLMSPELRGSSQWVYWVSLPPEVGWVFKLDPSLTTGTPYLSSLLPEFLNQGVMRSLQKDMNIASATKILSASIPLLKDQGAKVANALALDPKLTGQFLALVQGALSSAIKLAVAPIENISAVSFDGDSEMYDTWLRTALASSGQNTAMFYTSKLKANSTESQLSFQSDSLMMEQQLYPQMSNFLNYFIGRKLSKFKYNFMFEGNAYYLSRQQRLDKANALAMNGIVLPQLYSSALGLKPQDFYRMLEESKAIGFVDKLTPIVSSFQQPAGKDGAGRPQKSDSEIGDAGQDTRDSGTNIDKGGKV